MGIKTLGTRPAGYDYLLSKFSLASMPRWHHSSVVKFGSQRQKILNDDHTEDIYPAQYWPGKTVGGHLEFALKYDGVNLSCLKIIFYAVEETEVVDYIKSKPTGKYARRIWFLYEFLTDNRLPIEDLSMGTYLQLLEPEIYYTIAQGKRSRRHRIVNNLLGTKEFCPIVRKTEKLKEMDSVRFLRKCEDIIKPYPPLLIKRALGYLYNKETKSSFEIENIKPSATRTEKFIASLSMAKCKDFCDKESLINLQNQIVDSRFKNKDYRTTQNYVGQTTSYQKEYIHYICPKPENVPSLMRGLFDCHQLIMEGNVSTVVHAAVISYGFIFIHPFEDGNGRIHRFLIHNILCIRGTVPKDLMFPVSAVMLNNPESYDDSLEKFSFPLKRLAKYSLDELGQMTVHNDMEHWYRYMDMTAQAESLYNFIDQTVEKELTEELSFLASYDETKRTIQDVVDMPNRLIDLFIRLCLQNNGTLSAKKRESHFSFLTDDELISMESALRGKYNDRIQ